ncbi:hypothetical protein ACFSTI_13580 [Rhizorhabdus histidinilytica]
MTRVRGGGLSIFWQTLLLLLASVAVVFVVTVALFVWSPPPRPDFNSLSDIAEALAGRKIPRERRWRVMVVPAAAPARSTCRRRRPPGRTPTIMSANGGSARCSGRRRRCPIRTWSARTSSPPGSPTGSAYRSRMSGCSSSPTSAATCRSGAAATAA